MSYLPRDFEKALSRLETPRASRPLLEKRLRKEGGKLDPKIGPFVTSADNLRRYGFALPKPLAALLEIADEWLVEDARTKSFKYLRVAPGGWDLPLAIEDEHYAVTVMKRFEWNTFSNMQLWEHFAGTMSLGWDPGDNRYMVSTQSAGAPVFWMDHETAEMTNAVASSLERFLRVQVGDDAKVPARERQLSAKPSIWDREGDDVQYLDATDVKVPLTSWPPFLAARAHWMLSCVAFREPSNIDAPEAAVFDFDAELPFVAKKEPLALFWMLRAFYVGQRDVFDEVRARAAKVSPLAKSFGDVIDAQWSQPAKVTPVRTAVQKNAKLPRKAKFTKTFSRDRLV